MTQPIVIGIVFTLAAGMLLTSCSNGTPSSKPPEASMKESMTATIYDRGRIPASEGNYEENRWTKWINQNGPAQITFTAVPRYESQQRLNTLFASARAPDLIFEYSPGIKNLLYDQKQLMPLDDLIDNFSVEYKKILQDHPVLRRAGMKSDGMLYEFGKMNEVFPLNAVFIRADWLKKLNLDMPQTTEDLYKVVKAFAWQDPDGNGIKDTYGMSMSFQSNEIISGIFGSIAAGQAGYLIENGQMVKTWENDKAAADFKKRLYEEGLIDSDYFNDTNGAKAKQDFLNGKMGIYSLTVPWFEFTVNDMKTLKKHAPGAEVVPMPLPKGAAGQFIPSLQNPIQMTAVVNAKAKAPQTVMKYVDYLTKVSTGRAIYYGLEGQHYTIGKSGCPQVTDENKYKTEVTYAYDYDMLYSKLQDGKCGLQEAVYNLNIPAQKEGFEIYKKAQEAYLQTDKRYPGVTHPEHMPQLPKELQLSLINLNKQISDIWIKAIVSGSTYTTEQALRDAKILWQNANGDKIDRYYEQWYEANKTTAFLAKDIFDIVNQQKQLNNKYESHPSP